MSRFSSEICPDTAESVYTQQCWELLLSESPAIHLELIRYLYSFAWTVDIFRNIVTILLILNNKSSGGISCRAQFIYVLAGILRFSNDFEVNEWIFFFPKYFSLVVTFGLFIAAYTFQSRKDIKYDDQSLPLLIFGCTIIAMLRMDRRLSMSLIHLSLILEVAALFAQSWLSQKKRAESSTVNFFLTTWFFSKILMNMYYILLAYVSFNRFRATRDVGFYYFGTHGYHIVCNFMLLGYLYNHAVIRKIEKEELKKPKKCEQLVMCRSDK